jgi:hypothetical protein
VLVVVSLGLLLLLLVEVVEVVAAGPSSMELLVLGSGCVTSKAVLARCTTGHTGWGGGEEMGGYVKPILSA